MACRCPLGSDTQRRELSTQVRQSILPLQPPNPNFRVTLSDRKDTLRRTTHDLVFLEREVRVCVQEPTRWVLGSKALFPPKAPAQQRQSFISPATDIPSCTLAVHGPWSIQARGMKKVARATKWPDEKACLGQKTQTQPNKGNVPKNYKENSCNQQCILYPTVRVTDARKMSLMSLLSDFFAVSFWQLWRTDDWLTGTCDLPDTEVEGQNSLSLGAVFSYKVLTNINCF